MGCREGRRASGLVGPLPVDSNAVSGRIKFLDTPVGVRIACWCGETTTHLVTSGGKSEVSE